jgi:hypothetical protein
MALEHIVVTLGNLKNMVAFFFLKRPNVVPKPQEFIIASTKNLISHIDMIEA